MVHGNPAHRHGPGACGKGGTTYAGEVKGWRIGHIGGTPLLLARSWPIGVLVLGAFYVTGLMSSMPLVEAIGYSIIAVLGLFASVLAHEVSHGLAGRALRRPPEAYTLTLWGGHTTFRAPEGRPRDMALIAAAGPASNLVLALLFWLLLVALRGEPFWILAPLAWVNLALGVFNLLPGLPMDGGHLVHALGWAVTGRRDSGMVLAGRLGQVLALGVAAYGLVPLLLGGDTGTNLWALLIGAFLWQGATQSVRVARARQSVADVDLRRWMAPALAIDAAARVGDVPPTGGVVLDGGRPVAVVTVEAMQQGADPGLPVGAVARAIAPESVLRVPVGADAVAALGRAARHGDVVVLADGYRLWTATVAQLAQHLRR